MSIKISALVLFASAAVLNATPSFLDIRGTVQRPSAAHRLLGAHVHVHLLDAHGAVIAERQARLSTPAPRKDASSGYRSSYWVKFTPEEAARATSHRTLFHPQKDHSSCD